MTRWSHIPDTNHEVSDQGEVRHAVTHRKAAPHFVNGYPRVRIQHNGKRHGFRIHRLVASAFCVKPDGCTEVNHKNGKKTDNRAENLEWVTRSGNIRHAFQNGLYERKLNCEDNKLVRLLYEYGFKQEAIANLFEVSQPTIWRAVNKLNKSEVLK